MDDLERVEVTEILVPYRDIDMTGRLHNAAYLAYAETALSHFWRYRPPLEDEPHFQATKIEIRLHEPLRLDDRLRLTVTVDKIGGKSIGFNVRMMCEGILAAEIEIIWAAIDPASGEPIGLPEDTRDWLYGYLK
jgi:acyl-CoA thioester hydrolase